MPIVGMNFTAINAERKAGGKGKIDVHSNVSVDRIEESKLGTDKNIGANLYFTFNVKYTPDVGSIVLKGEVNYMNEEKVIKEIMAEWKKTKQLPKQAMTEIFNPLLTKSNVEAILISKELSLPVPVPLPRMNIEKKV